MPYAIAFAALAALAQVEVPSGTTVTQTGPGWGIASTTTMANARVLAVDVPTRRMDLELADGRVIGLAVGAEVRRLGEIRAGDVVNVAFTEALMASVAVAAMVANARRQNVLKAVA